jgi:hypothetical protein
VTADPVDRLLDSTPRWKVYHTPIGVVAIVRSTRADFWARALEGAFEMLFEPNLDGEKKRQNG